MEEKRTEKEVHEDYDGFVAKFRRKKTTDDCMTPPGCALFTSCVTFLTTRLKSLVDALTSFRVPVALSSIFSENFTSLLAILICFNYIWSEITNGTYHDYCIPSLFARFPLYGIAIRCDSFLAVLLL